MWNSQGKWRPSWKCHNMWHIRKMLLMLLLNSVQSLTVLTFCAQWMVLAALLCPNEIASRFSQNFANIGPKLASTIHHEGKNFSSYHQNQGNATCFFLNQQWGWNLEDYLKKLGSRKSAGHDKIKADLIKCVADEVAKPLSAIVNVFISWYISWWIKKCQGFPHLQKENPESFGNYRPVPVLPCISKILSVSFIMIFCLKMIYCIKTEIILHIWL